MISDPQRRQAFLNRLNIPEQTFECFREALLEGFRSRGTATPFNAMSAPGFQHWNGTLGKFREDMAPYGWVCFRWGNLDLLISPNGRDAICVSSGNAHTGTTGEGASPPGFARPKGASISRGSRANAGGLFPDFQDPLAEEALPFVNFWIFLFHYDVEAQEIRSEVSMPTDAAGTYAEWADRHIFDAISLGTDPEVDRGASENEFDAPVTRRTPRQ